MSDTTDSEIKRYNCHGSSGYMSESDIGDYVIYADALEWKDRLAAVTAEMQSENNEQARLLGISAERELKLLTELKQTRKDQMRQFDLFRELQVALEQSRAECERLRVALQRVANWHGEFPVATLSTGEQCSYAAAYGSNGERDFMRSLAKEAIAQQEKGDGN